MSEIRGAFQPGKLLGLFTNFDPNSPQQREAIRRFERSLRAKTPELLNYNAYWQQAWNAKPDQVLDTEKAVSNESKVKLLIQNKSDSCGAASIAMCVNALEGKHLTDLDLIHRYGSPISLLAAAQGESPHWKWSDAGDYSEAIVPAIRDCLTAGGLGAIGLNGPEFSPSGYGHVLAIVGMTKTTFRLADPATGQFRTVSRDLVAKCRPHSDGKFVLLATPR